MREKERFSKKRGRCENYVTSKISKYIGSGIPVVDAYAVLAFSTINRLSPGMEIL